MSLAIYKPGQGYWTRLMSAIGLGTLAIMGAVWVSQLVANVRIAGYPSVYTRAAVMMLVMAVFAVIGYQLLGRSSRVVDFMIATESEMKKVNWSTRREIIGSTWVVIIFTAFLGVLCFCLDLFFQMFFQWIRVLES